VGPHPHMILLAMEDVTGKTGKEQEYQATIAALRQEIGELQGNKEEGHK
jgi:hypothetical protein